MHNHVYNHKTLKDIWHQVPPDYYQIGVKKNLFQRYWHTQKLHIITNSLALYKKPPEKILDVGSSSGWLLFEISKRFPSSKCFGIDVYQKAITYGKQLYKNLSLIHADAHKIPFPNETFDVVICTEVLEHVVNPEKVLKEIRRVLRSNGIAVIEMDSGNWLFKIVWHWWTNIRNGAWKDSHINAFHAKKLGKMIQDSGFKIWEQKFFNYSMAVAYFCKKTTE